MPQSMLERTKRKREMVQLNEALKVAIDEGRYEDAAKLPTNCAH